MLIELGHYALIMAGVLAALQAGFGLFGAQRRDGFLMDFSGSAALAQTLGCLIAFGALMHAYVTSDFSVQNVWQNSIRIAQTPAILASKILEISR